MLQDVRMSAIVLKEYLVHEALRYDDRPSPIIVADAFFGVSDAHRGKPKILHTDQGSQFTSIDFIKTPKDANIQISMGGKGAWRENVFVERLWPSLKQEAIYLEEINDGRHAQRHADGGRTIMRNLRTHCRDRHR